MFLHASVLPCSLSRSPTVLVGHESPVGLWPEHRNCDRDVLFSGFWPMFHIDRGSNHCEFSTYTRREAGEKLAVKFGTGCYRISDRSH